MVVVGSLSPDRMGNPPAWPAEAAGRRREVFEVSPTAAKRVPGGERSGDQVGEVAAVVPEQGRSKDMAA